MKTKILILVILGCSVFNVFAQTKRMKSVVISDFDEPFDLMSIKKGEKEEIIFSVDSNTILKNKKGEHLKVTDLQEGYKISIVYKENDDEKLITEAELENDADGGKLKFKGLYDGYDGTFAYIDGRRVKLAAEGSIRGSKSGDGKIDKDFTGFDDVNLKKGYKMEVKGLTQLDGSILADEILVNKNISTKHDEIVIGMVSKSFDGNGLKRMDALTGMFNPANGLYKGNIKVGSVNYELSDDLKLQAYINEVGYKLIPAYTHDAQWQKENSKIDFRFYVVDDDIPNAFAWPNGMVFIHTGLLKIIENESQLAFVLSHEISHVLYEHGSSRFKKQEQIKRTTEMANTGAKVFGTIKGLLNKGDQAAALPNAANLNAYKYYALMQKFQGLDDGVLSLGKINDTDKTISLTLNTIGQNLNPDALSGLFGKHQENQADRVGLYYAQAAGYDIREVPKFWKNMMAKNSDPTFLGKITDNFTSMMQKPTINVSLTGDLKTQLINSSSQMIVNNIFKSVYSSHPLSKNRLKSTDQSLITTYQKTDFGQTKVGDDDYKKYVGNIK